MCKIIIHTQKKSLSNSAMIQSTLINEHQQWTHIHVASLATVCSDATPQAISGYLVLLFWNDTNTFHVYTQSAAKSVKVKYILSFKFHTGGVPGSQTSNYQRYRLRIEAHFITQRDMHTGGLYSTYLLTLPSLYTIQMFKHILHVT